MNKTMKCAVIGAGPMGLMTALRLAQSGAQVTIFEADDRIGGMSASFDFEGLQVERYYHFICKSDYPLFDLLKELNLEKELRWTDTSMSFFYNGKLFPWGTPQALLTFPGLPLLTKIRYALQVMVTKSVKDWSKLDKKFAHVWLKKWIGEKGFSVLWEPLFRYKFYEHETSLSAAWIATRIKRVALSRKNIFQEQLGYLSGGSERLLAAMMREIEALGGSVKLRSPVQAIVSNGSQISGVRTKDGLEHFDAVVSTIPLPYLTKMAPQLPEPEMKKISAIKNVAVACVLLRLRRPFTKSFWTNINSPQIEIPGLIEYTNLNPIMQNGEPVHLLYAPFYMPKTHPKYGRESQDFIHETIDALKRIRPEFSADDIISGKTHKYEFSQTVCTPEFYSKLPPMKSQIQGLFYADTSYYYPEDRSICESLVVGEKLALSAAQHLSDRAGVDTSSISEKIAHAG